MPDSSVNLIDQLLAEQQSLTAVEAFSRHHDTSEPSGSTTPAQEQYYRDLIPMNRPGAGEQYAFEVDLDACTGCKSCVAACHSLNGLHENESWRDVGILSGGPASAPVVQTVTSACHHCIEPACMDGCPTMAYEKDPETGIVRHLDDQCIGCQYCILKCPYDVPKYDADLGIVRKCDMCIGRLKEGEAPACVQSCPSGAIAIKIIKTESVEERASDPAHRMIAGAFQSEYTKPTTTFRRKTPLPDGMVAADEQNLTPEHAHLPLVWMLTLTQTGAGLFCLSALLRLISAPVSATVQLAITIAGLLFAVIGIGSSVLHLGSPMGAWRAFLGLKTSWLSREIIVFGGWAPLAALVVGLQYLELEPWLTAAAIACALTSLAGVFCSVMVYADTRRDFWRFDRTLTRFTANLLVGGSAVTIGLLSISHESIPTAIYTTLALGVLLRIIIESLSLTPARQTHWSFAKKSALVQIVSLRNPLIARWICLLAGTLLIFIAPVAGSITLIAGEWLARYLYFRAVAAPKMPGNV